MIYPPDKLGRYKGGEVVAEYMLKEKIPRGRWGASSRGMREKSRSARTSRIEESQTRGTLSNPLYSSWVSTF